MSVITIRLPDKLLRDLDLSADSLHVARAEYIRLAIINMNNEINEKKRIERLKKLSLRVRKDSMRINKEFSKIERDIKD